MSKEGPNKLRLFHCCALPKAKQCQHFSWADLHHPKVIILHNINNELKLFGF